ncbi:MAG TPA: methyltransferase domain-containing protein [Nocardioides sp.]|nr:methyltransferase domain-containing protein [Nocardioides sp.]
MTNISEPSGWQVRGSAAENYERYLVPALFASWVPDLLDAAGVRDGHRVLDVACGTGIVARGAAGRVGANGRVVGLDINDGMLETAKAADVGGVVEWKDGDASEIPFGDGDFDAVLCQQGLQFVPDPVRAAGEMGRVVGDGPVVVSVWSPLHENVVWDRFADALGRHAGAGAAEIMRSPFQLSDPDRLREVFTRAGFSAVDLASRTHPARFASAEAMVREEQSSSPLAEPVGALDSEAWGALVEDVATILAEHSGEEGISFPMHSQIVTARR